MEWAVLEQLGDVSLLCLCFVFVFPTPPCSLDWLAGDAIVRMLSAL